MNGPDRQESLGRALQGNQEALGDLLESYRNYLRMVAGERRPESLRGRLGESDLVQDTMAEALRTFNQFRGRDTQDFRRWLRGVVVNVALNHVRDHHALKRDARRDQVLGELQLLSTRCEAPGAQLVRDEEAVRCADALARLADEDQCIILSRFRDDLTHQEIAAGLGLTEAVVRQRFSRAMKRLRELLGPNDQETHPGE